MGSLLAMLPAISTAAGGSTAAAGSIMTTLAAGSSIVGGLASMARANAASDAAEIQSRQVELQGRMDAINTNKELLKTLSRNNVATAVSGLQSAGSIEYAKQQSMANAAEQLNINRLNVDMKKQSLSAEAKAAKTQGLFDAVSSGITAGDIIGSSLRTKKRTK